MGGAIAAASGLDFGVARKRRLGDHEVRVELPDRQFVGRPVVLVDDVASTGHTLAEAAKLLALGGAASIMALVTHALFVGDALARIGAAGVADVCSTDSVAHPSNRLHLDTLLADALVDASDPAAR